MAQTPEDFRKQIEESHAKNLALFPFKLIEVPGKDAFIKWQELRSSSQGTPVILGDATPERFSNLASPFDPYWGEKRSAAEIIKAAENLAFPADLISKHKSDETRAADRFESDLRKNPNMPLPQTIVIDSKNGTSRTLSREEVIAQFRNSRDRPLPMGSWPDKGNPSPGLTVVTDIVSGKFLDNVYLTVIPTDDWTTIPAYLRWGDWNENPAAEWHVAAMRTWRDRYGVELVGMGFDTLNLRVNHPARSREEAVDLALAQYVYCSDIVDQGVGSINQLAKDLMENDWWFFWWD